MNRHDTHDRRIIVIGGGLAGLAAACTLAARGYAATLFEKNRWLGGKAAVLREKGFRFDMGPTILTMPKVLGRIFAEAGRDMHAELDLVRLDPQWRCFFDAPGTPGPPGSPGSTLDLHENVAAMQRTLKTFCPGKPQAAEAYGAFIEYAKRLHDISDRFFFWKPIGGIGDMFDPKTSFDLATLRDVLAMRMGRSVASTIRKHTPDPRVAQMLDHFTQYVGSSPYGSPAILCGIAHMQTDEGVWYPIGGTRAVPEALQKLAIDLGVELRTGVGVERIVTRDGGVEAVELDTGERVPCAAVVSNMDAVRTQRELLRAESTGGMQQPGDREPACSGVVLYLGLSRRYDHLAHHDFVFSRDPEEEFDWIYRKGEPAPDPTCYLAAPAATDPAVAPPGGEALYVLVHTPYLRKHHDWSQMLPAYRETILRKLERTGGMPDLRERIVFESHLTPQDIHDRYRVLNGAIYGLASHGTFLGAFKPSNRTATRGLYLAGGAAHPGPGMPMVLMSGWIAADALDRDGLVNKARPAAEREPHDLVAHPA